MNHHRDDDDDVGTGNDEDIYDADHASSPSNAHRGGSGTVVSVLTAVKLLAASALFYSAGSTFARTYYVGTLDAMAAASEPWELRGDEGGEPGALGHGFHNVNHGRRLTSAVSISMESPPSYMTELTEELKSRKKLMDETPPEEVKYWFEYTGSLQKYFYRYSRSRKKADSFEGRDDSGVISSRFVDKAGGGAEYLAFFSRPPTDIPEEEVGAYTRLLDNCLAMGSQSRPDRTEGSAWAEFFGKSKNNDATTLPDRCRILFSVNTVGAGRGNTLLWETRPPNPDSAEPRPWISEQETAATHLERNLLEIDAMCATGLIAARVQVLVCEPIPGAWTDWMESLLPHCGGRIATPSETGEEQNPEDRPSPVQVVVAASASTADNCHDLKSGFMEQRMQDLVLAPPYLTDRKADLKGFDPSVKTTHPDLVSSDSHDLYVTIKWSTLVTIRGVHAFLQASADVAAAAASASPDAGKKEDEDGVTVSLSDEPSSPFLVPSFVRVSYVSEENNKVAKWRMHGDFFHPAAWEVCKDSFDVSWIPNSLSGSGGVTPVCDGSQKDCGQWWAYFAEEQMPVTPEIYANEVTPPLVQGGSNYVWMLTERQRQEIVKIKVCEHSAGDDKKAKEACGEHPQAVIPLGDLESFLMNFTPNTALGKKHKSGRMPGYSRAKERDLDREKVRERKQLKDQDDIEKALFDYNIYPSALFHKDSTIKAARARDYVLTGEKRDPEAIGPQKVKSSYYDVTITKPREATLAWCQAISRKGLCTLYADYFRSFADERCLEACGMRKNWTKVQRVADEL